MKYSVEPDLTSAEFIDVLRRSTLAERRPVDDGDQTSEDAIECRHCRDSAG